MKILLNEQAVGAPQSFSASDIGKVMVNNPSTLRPTPSEILISEVSSFGALGDVQADLNTMSIISNMPNVTINSQFSARYRFQDGFTIECSPASGQNIDFQVVYSSPPIVVFAGFNNINATSTNTDVVKNDIAINNITTIGFQWGGNNSNRTSRLYIAWGYS
jgi:hypothetical protein